MQSELVDIGTFMNVPFVSPIRCMHRAVDLYGKKIGVVSGDRRFTYAEFGERCDVWRQL